MVTVHNLYGTGDNSPPIGFSSWKEWWKYKRAESSANVQSMDAITMLLMAHMYRKQITDMAMKGTLCLFALAVTSYTENNSFRLMITTCSL